MVVGSSPSHETCYGCIRPTVATLNHWAVSAAMYAENCSGASVIGSAAIWDYGLTSCSRQSPVACCTEEASDDREQKALS